MKKKNVFIWLSFALILSLSFTTSAINLAEDEVPRPTSIDHTSFL
ncbi:hypothetical protein [Psychrobacillus sp. NPDC093180]|nr:hypothetical protein GCM10011384_15910 [Psychrobacillus lasiicapitis]